MHRDDHVQKVGKKAELSDIPLANLDKNSSYDQTEKMYSPSYEDHAMHELRDRQHLPKVSEERQEVQKKPVIY